MTKFKDIYLVNPIHLKLIDNGHGEFPDGYKLTDKGIKYLKDFLFENIKGEIELANPPKEYSSEMILASIKQLIEEF